MLPFISVLFLVEFVRGAFLVSFLPTYAVDQLGFTVAAVGIAVSVHYLFDTFVKSVAGYLLDRLSIRLIINTGLLISLIGLYAMKNAFQLWLLIAAAALFAIGISPIWLICLSKVTSQHRAAQMGILYTFWLVGLGSGPVIMNFVIDKSYNLSYWLMIGLWAAAWLLSLRINNRTESIPETIALGKQLSMLWERLSGLGSLLPGMILQTAAAGILVPVLPGFASKKSSGCIIPNIHTFYS